MVIVFNVLIAYSAMATAKLTYVRSRVSYIFLSFMECLRQRRSQMLVKFSVQSTNASERHSTNLDATNVYDVKLEANFLVGRHFEPPSRISSAAVNHQSFRDQRPGSSYTSTAPNTY